MKFKTPVPLGLMASGRGSNLLNIVRACEEGRLDAYPAIVISNNLNAGALKIARERDIPALYLSSRTHPDAEALDHAIKDALVDHNVNLLVLAGYMKKIGAHTLHTYRNRIVNIHPSLLPAHGGKGMFGMKVHEAVIAAGEKETGVTVHMVNEDYDQGKVLARRAVPVKDSDTIDSLAERVLGVEHELYPTVLQDIIAGRIDLDN